MTGRPSVSPEQARAELERRRREREERNARPAITPEQARAELERRRSPTSARPRQSVSTGEDVARSAGTGVVRGVGGTIGAPTDLGELASDGLSAGFDWIVRQGLRAVGMSDADIDRAQANVEAMRANQGVFGARLRRNAEGETEVVPNPTVRWWPSGADVTNAIDSVIPGDPHEPQTRAGRYARTIGEFLPGAAAPGGAVARAARVVVPAVASEAAGEATAGTPIEPLARFGAAVVAGGGVEALARPYAPSAGYAARLRRELTDLGASADDARTVEDMFRAGAPVDDIRAAVSRVTGADDARIARAPLVARQLEIDPGAEFADLERDFMPLTRGERARDTASMQREASLRRAGPERAQSILQDFEADRGQRLQDSIMRRVATKGRDPISDSSASAGTMVADDLRSRFAAMQEEQGRLYQVAMDRARQQVVSGSDELRATTGALVEAEFLDAPQALGVINRLSDQIARGSATYESVERARQALNRLLGASMRSGDDAQTYAIRRITDHLDEWVEPRLNGEARAAIAEARRYTAEMLSWFGEQSRPILSTGHRGRRDLGGARVERIIDTDIEADAVVDSIFGASNRPAAATMSTVRRIVGQARETINSGGYQAPTGGVGRIERNALRRTLRGGRATRGGRQFESTTEPIDNPALQGLREAFVYRLTRPLANRGGGDAVPFGTLRNNLRAALGANRNITKLLFNEAELAELDRVLTLIDRATPPAGSYSPSAPGIARDASERSAAAISARLLRLIPGGVGEALGGAIDDAVVNARAVRDARQALAPPPPPPPPIDLRRRTNPRGTEVVIAGGLGANAAREDEPAYSRDRRRRETAY